MSLNTIQNALAARGERRLGARSKKGPECLDWGLFLGDQFLLLTHSGLIWYARNEPWDVVYVPMQHKKALLLCVLGHLADPAQLTVHDTLELHDITSSPAPYDRHGTRPLAASPRAQQVLAWFVRRDPRVVVSTVGQYAVNVPPTAFRVPQDPEYRILLGNRDHCLLSYPPSLPRLLVVQVSPPMVGAMEVGPSRHRLGGDG